MRHEMFIIKSKCKIPITHTFSSALNAVKRSMFVLGLRMFLIESFPGFLECTTEKKILHKLLHAKTNLPLGAHIFVSRVCTCSLYCTYCTVHTLPSAHSGHAVHLGRVQCIVYCEWAFWPPPDIGLGIDVQGQGSISASESEKYMNS